MNHFFIRDEDEIDLTWGIAVSTRRRSPSAAALLSRRQLVVMRDQRLFFSAQLGEKPGLFSYCEERVLG